MSIVRVSKFILLFSYVSKLTITDEPLRTFQRKERSIYCRIWWLIHNEFVIRALKSKTGEMIFIIKCQALVKYIYSRSTLFSCSILCSIWWPSGYSNYKFNITYLPISVKKHQHFCATNCLKGLHVVGKCSWKNWEVGNSIFQTQSIRSLDRKYKIRLNIRS